MKQRAKLKISSVFLQGVEVEEEEEEEVVRPIDRVLEHQELGCEKAEKDDSWGALQCWGKALAAMPHEDTKQTALELNHRCATLHELKAQVLLSMDLLVKACHEAHCSVNYVPCWAISRQTLGE